MASLEGTELAVRASLAQGLGLARRRWHEDHRLSGYWILSEREAERGLIGSQMVLEAIQSIVILLVVLALVRLRGPLPCCGIGLLASRVQPLRPPVVVRSARALQLARRALAAVTVARATGLPVLTSVLARH